MLSPCSRRGHTLTCVGPLTQTGTGTAPQEPSLTRAALQLTSFAAAAAAEFAGGPTYCNAAGWQSCPPLLPPQHLGATRYQLKFQDHEAPTAPLSSMTRNNPSSPKAASQPRPLPTSWHSRGVCRATGADPSSTAGPAL